MDARTHIGKEVTVCGEIKDYYSIQTGPDKPTLLLFDTEVVRRGAGADMVKFSDAFSVVILRKDWKISRRISALSIRARWFAPRASSRHTMTDR